MSHPLDPISRAEVDAAITILKSSGQVGDKPVFSSIALVEPEKSRVKSGEGARVVRVIGRDETPDGGFAVDVDLGSRTVATCTRLTGSAQAPYNHFDMETAVRLTKTDERWLAAVRKRGITDIELIQVDPWPGSGYRHPAIAEGHRSVRCIAFVRTDKTDNGYARPIHGLIAHVDLTLGTVVEVEDSGEVPIPPRDGRYDAAHQATTRQDLKSVAITQPDGPSFEVDGYHVRWQGWDFRISMHPVHGLVLHQLTLQGRSVLYRASLSEMVVPYGDRDGMHQWKHVLDASEYCMGMLVNSLKLGCDCLGEIHYFDVHQVSWDGKAKTISQAICMHEEDYGIQWKHYDGQSETSEVRRSRRLVVSSIHTIGNYDYGLFWYLYLDGTIQMEVKLTGIVGVSAVTPETSNPAQSPLIGENLASPVHQHLFCFRLDWDLDGGANEIHEMEIQPLPLGPENPDGTQFASTARHLTRELDARRRIAPERSRYWKVSNPECKNAWGVPVAYKLLPGASPTLFAHPDSVVARRASFARYNLWVTPYAPVELGAAGPLTVMHEGEGGLADLTSGNRDVSRGDLVMWHTLGVTHVPRPEDWPVMPVEYCGFHLIPVGFFDRNPTLDLPSHCHGS